MKRTMAAMQDDIANTIPKLELKESDSTACTVVIKENKIYTSNLGDSVAYLCEIDENGKTKPTSLNKKLDKPNETSEIQRIQNFLEQKKPKPSQEEIDEIINTMSNKDNPRLGGSKGIALTAALGDLGYDQFGIKHVPDQIDVAEINIPKNGKAFVIVACDGLTERLSNVDIESSLQVDPKTITAQKRS